MNEQFVDCITVQHRRWQVFTTIEEDGSVIFVRMTYGCAERQFRLGEEGDLETKAAAALVYQRLGEKLECGPDDDILIEDE